ncbi:hypothetical protein ABT224_19565 [Streptomyces sp. NPDC001584]|uniref:hypothetical protein n=1 Tax=Streptomyces sp. NPDC001584 TaxID=3154521 RepID=UPI003319B984
MDRNELLAKNRWKVRYSYTCTCDPTCYYEKDGRHTTTTFLNGGEQDQGTEAVADHLAQFHKQEGVKVEEVWQETDAERDARIAARQREAADEARGIWWGMGGAN